MTQLYFIGGASGSGKTAIMSELQTILGNEISVYDFDDIGVPEGADKKWRQESTEKWLQKLLHEGFDACLLGQIVLGEILACPSAKRIDKVNFCLLDVSDFERIQRLKKRNTYGADQNMLNWAAWLRMHHQDPQWTQHVLKENCWNGLDWSCWDQLDDWKNKANIQLLETTDFSIKEVAKKVANWITRNSQEFNNTYHFCPVCGRNLMSKIIDGKDHLVCSGNECSFVFWNNPIPVVGAIVETKTGVVLARNKQWNREIYSLITGFIDTNESPEDAVQRECKEELNLDAKDVSFIGVYPWCERNQIILVYHLFADGDVSTNDELHSVKILTREELKGWPFGQEELAGWPFGCGWAIKDWLNSI